MRKSLEMSYNSAWSLQKKYKIMQKIKLKNRQGKWNKCIQSIEEKQATAGSCL
jgi:hypothetical protein